MPLAHGFESRPRYILSEVMPDELCLRKRQGKSLRCDKREAGWVKKEKIWWGTKTNIKAIILENGENVGEINLILTPEKKIPMTIITRVGGFFYGFKESVIEEGELKLIYSVTFKEENVIR